MVTFRYAARSFCIPSTARHVQRLGRCFNVHLWATQRRWATNLHRDRSSGVDKPAILIPNAKSASDLHGTRLARDEVRLLYLLPNSHPSARVEGLLTRGKLDSSLRYAAMSYTCGNPFPPRSSDNQSEECERRRAYDQTRKEHEVFINGIKFPVSRNLFEGLARLRNVDRPAGLWVDAICANQQDNEEVGQVVSSMHNIYNQAEEVLVWLGESGSRANLQTALRLVDDIYYSFIAWHDKHRLTKFEQRWEALDKKARSTPDSENQKSFWEWLKGDVHEWQTKVQLRKQLSRTDRRAWQALDEFLSRSWFDRVWTWQEKELARSARLFVGSKSLSWRRLRFAMLLIMAHDQGQARPERLQLMPGRQYLHVVDNLNIDQRPTLLDIVMNVRHRDSFNKLDKIFGVLGAAERDTANSDAQHFLQKVDYESSVSEIYTEFARYHIEEKGDLRVLQACTPRTGNDCPEMPSWVADWSDMSPSHQLSSNIYDAAKGTPVEASYSRRENAMILTGVLVDRVTIAGQDPRIDSLEEMVDESASWDYWRDAIINTYMKVYVQGTFRGPESHMAYFGLPSESSWAAVADFLQKSDVYEPTSEPVSEAYWRTLMVDKKPGTKMDQNRRIEADLSVCRRFHRDALGRILDPGLRRQIERDFVHTRKPITVHNNAGRELSLPGWFDAMQRSVLHKRLFVTERGLLGMAPPNVKAGDLVCVLLGGSVPFLLREIEDYFHLIEEAYLHGYMDGKALEEGQMDPSRKRSFCIR